MDSMLPIITISQLQRSTKTALASVKDYAVVQSHGHDRAFILNPLLGRILLESGMLEKLRERARTHRSTRHPGHGGAMEQKLKSLIGAVLRELSKK